MWILLVHFITHTFSYNARTHFTTNFIATINFNRYFFIEWNSFNIDIMKKQCKIIYTCTMFKEFLGILNL